MIDLIDIIRTEYDFSSRHLNALRVITKHTMLGLN